MSRGDTWCHVLARALLAIKGLIISADVCPLYVLSWLKHAFHVWSCKWGSGTAGWMQMLSQGTASPCSWVSKHFPGYWGYFVSWFIGYFTFSAKQSELVQAIPSHPPPTLVKIPLVWSHSSEVCLSSPGGFFPDLFANLLVMDVQFTWFSIQKWNFFSFFFKVWFDSGLENPACVLLATTLQCAGCQEMKEHLLGLKAASCGTRFGSAQDGKCW